MHLRRLIPFVVLLLICALPAGSVSAATSGSAVTAKKRPPKCKVGNNKKKCRCPKKYTVKKTRKGYKCVKKVAPKPPAADENPGTDEGGSTDPVTEDPGTTDPGTTDPGTTDPGTTDPGTTDPGTTDPGTTDPGTGTGPQPVRNDQALSDALSSAAARKYESSGGYSIYTYNFMPDVLGEADGKTIYSLRYCTFSWYPGFGNSRDNYNGAWVVKEGFTRPDQPSLPGLVTGNIYLYRQGMPQDQVLDAGIAVYQGNATINVPTGQTYFTGGDFSFKPGQATTDCAQWEE